MPLYDVDLQNKMVGRYGDMVVVWWYGNTYHGMAPYHTPTVWERESFLLCSSRHTYYFTNTHIIFL